MGADGPPDDGDCISIIIVPWCLLGLNEPVALKTTLGLPTFSCSWMFILSPDAAVTLAARRSGTTCEVVVCDPPLVVGEPPPQAATSMLPASPAATKRLKCAVCPASGIRYCEAG
jgi:hypothetical protein